MALTYLFLGFVLALAVVAVGIAAVYGRLKRTRWRHTNIQGYLDLIPDLSPEQKARVQEIRRTFLPKVAGIRRSLCLERVELARQLFAEPTDRSAIAPIAEKILRHQAELEHEVVEHILEEKDLLGPAQRQRFYAIIMEQFASGGLGVHDVRESRK